MKKMYAAADIALPVSGFFWVGKYKEVEKQCKEHGVSQCGAIADMIKNLREYYKLHHVETTFKARAVPLSAWLKREPRDKNTDG